MGDLNQSMIGGGGQSAPWDTQLFDCTSDCKIFLVSWCCACCQLSHQRAVLDNKDCSIVDAALISLCLLCCQVKIRSDLRTKYGIEGSMGSDCCMSYYCMPCAIAQQQRQLQLKGDRPQGCFME